MKNIKKDALGVYSAIELKNSNYDLISSLYIRQVCVAVINRYDKSNSSAKLVKLATEILSTLNSNYSMFRISDIKKLCENLIKEEL